MEPLNRSMITKMWSNNLVKRSVSAAVMIPIVLYIVASGGLLYQALLIIASLLMAYEWSLMIGHKHEEYSDKQRQKWLGIGLIYISVSVLSLLYLRQLDAGRSIIFTLLMLIWTIDIAAYVFGKTIGGPKIAPAISPKKTWAGLIGGMVMASFLLVVLGLLYGSKHDIFVLIVVGCILTILAQAGDFFESWIKRRFDVKDSGHLIPGHGGILDRVDGLVVIAIVTALSAIFNGGTVPLW